MASAIRDHNGRVRILFVDGAGARRTIRFGRLDRRAAEAVKHCVERLAEARRSGTLPPAHVAAWRDALPDREYARLARAGLADPRQAARGVTLAELVERFTACKAVRKSTAAAYRQATSSLLAFFGDDRAIADISPEDADRWFRSLADDGYAVATRAKRAFVARAIFGRAVLWELLARNPFRHLRPGPQTNAARQAYISADAIGRVLEACPSDQWRAVFMLARFAALRCPSEIVGLTWDNVDFARKALTVHAAKTEHHGDGHAVRVAPIRPELYDLLLRMHAEAPDGSIHVVPMLRDPRRNLRTSAIKIVLRAGLTPWPRLFQNLRASCVTDWAERFPLKDVARWAGHNVAISLAHYQQGSDAIFAAATEHRGGGAESGAPGAQKAARSLLASNRAECTESLQVSADTGVTTPDYTCRNSLTNTELGAAGFEPA